MLLQRQRDVQMIDSLAANDVGRFLEAAKQRQAAIAKMITARPVVDEADDLIAEFPVLEHLVGNHSSQLAGARDENPAQSHTGHPSPLQRLAHEFSREIAECDVENEEDGPSPLGHLVSTHIPLGIGGVVGADVQSHHDAEYHGDDAADEHVEEIIDA